MSFLGWDTHPPPSLMQSLENDTAHAINYSSRERIDTKDISQQHRHNKPPRNIEQIHEHEKIPTNPISTHPATAPIHASLDDPTAQYQGTQTMLWMSQIPPWFLPYMQAQTPKTTTFANWPKFGKNMDFYMFYLKLSTILETSEWGNGKLIRATKTTPELAQLSALLFQGLLSCLKDEPLLPFVNNSQYTNKQIEMLQELFCTFGGFEGKTDHEMMMDFYTSKIQPGETIDDFALRLRTFSIRLRALSTTVSEYQLTNTFVYGLCKNFKDIKSAHDKKTLEWQNHGLEWAKHEANGIRQNLQNNGN